MEQQIALASEFLSDAQLLLESERFRSALSRAYYAVYHLAIVLFETHGLKPSHFMGKSNRPALTWEHVIVTRQFFHEFCVKRKLFTWQRGQTIREIYRNRLTADYHPEAIITNDYAVNAVHIAQEFFLEIRNVVRPE